jgi:hypothetical protein
MAKIASTGELRSELERVLTLCRQPNPSRTVVAAELRALADRLAELRAASDLDSPETLIRFKKRLTDEMNKYVHGAGHVVDVQTEGPGSGWTVVFDTEYAALKAFYIYRKSNPNFGKSSSFGGWYISVR